LQGRHVGIEMKLLKDKADIGPQPGQVDAVIVQRRPIHYQFAFLKLFQAIDAADQRGFARSARAADDHHLTGLDPQIDVS
jgi:hypothetical protein